MQVRLPDPQASENGDRATHWVTETLTGPQDSGQRWAWAREGKPHDCERAGRGR